MLGGLDRPDSGKVLIEGQDISCLKDEELARFRRRKIGFIFQDYNLVPSLNVWENIVLPIGLDGKKADKEFVSSIVERIGIQDKLGRFQTLCPADSSSGLPSRAPWRPGRPLYLPTNLPATWIPKRSWR